MNQCPDAHLPLARLRAPLLRAGSGVIVSAAGSRNVHANAKGLSITYLNCPHCGLTITPKADWLAVKHCPRCIARRGILVTLFASSLPVDALYGEDARPDPERSKPAGPRPAPTT